MEASSREIYMKTTPRVVVNGTNFNVKDTQLFFDPPLQEGVVIQKSVRARAVYGRYPTVRQHSSEGNEKFSSAKIVYKDLNLLVF